MSHSHAHTATADLHPRTLARRPYDRGLHDLGNGVFAYMQPDGTWGWSNAGLIVDGDDALLVDTLFDLSLSGTMLEAMRRADKRAEHIGTIVNTHANPDHTNGNSLLPDARIIASVAAAREMAHDDPAVLARIMRGARQNTDIASRYFTHCFGAFDFENIPRTNATQTFSGQLTLNVGSKRVELIELGSAHTGGDIIIYVPEDRVVYAGDLLFIGGHPIMWAGPIDNWINACNHLLALDVDLIVPGHGPITDFRGVNAVRDYLVLVRDRAGAAHRAQITAFEAARSIASELKSAGYAQWNDAERICATVAAIYRHLNNERGPPDPAAMFGLMGQFRADNP